MPRIPKSRIISADYFKTEPSNEFGTLVVKFDSLPGLSPSTIHTIAQVVGTAHFGGGTLTITGDLTFETAGQIYAALIDILRQEQPESFDLSKISTLESIPQPFESGV